MNSADFNGILKLLFTAGDEIFKIYRSDDWGEESKADRSPVTKADKNSSRLINRGLNSLFPGVPVVDEENPIPLYSERKNWKQFFLLDPLDGTKEFIRQNGEFCINLALLVNNIPVQGWIYHPVSGKGWYCRKGEGITEFDKSYNFQKVGHEIYLPQNLKIVTSRSFFNLREESLIELVRVKYNAGHSLLGSSLKHIYIAQGKANLYLKASYSAEWDTAPGQLIVEESGGAVLRFDDFKTLEYNKPFMENPDFVMIDKKFNNPEFINYLKELVRE